MKEEIFSAEEFIDAMHKTIKEDRSTDSYPRFNRYEIEILSEIIFNKPKDFILFRIADYMADHYYMGVPVFANGASMRRLQFYKNFIASNGNAAKAAIKTGYSPKSAKQQGHRTLRWIQSSHEKSMSGF